MQLIHGCEFFNPSFIIRGSANRKEESALWVKNSGIVSFLKKRAKRAMLLFCFALWGNPNRYPNMLWNLVVENVNLSKTSFVKCEFYEKGDFGSVNFVKNEILEM